MTPTAPPAMLSEASSPRWPYGPHPVLLGLNNSLLGLLVFTGAFVVFEGPYNVAFILCAIAVVTSGARLNWPLSPMIILTLIYVVGGLAALMKDIDDFIPQRYIVTIFFLACTCFYFSMIIQVQTSRRLDIIRNASIISAVIACFIGLIGYLDIAGLAVHFRVYEGRASGTFRDPNVFGSFLIFPAMLLMQDVLIGERRGVWWRAIAFLLVVAMIFLSFSRGSWVAFAAAAIMLVILTRATEPEKSRRLVLLGVAAAIVFVLGVAAILSIDDIRDVFEQRARVTQSYDEGRTGRFGKILYSLPLLLDNPLGLVPLQYGKIFKEDPHNVYVNGFANFGWAGGVAYLALIASTCVVGFRQAMERSPWRREAITVWCALFVQFMQGFQIDTNTWRHLNMLIGLIWGMMAAFAMMKRRAARAPIAASQPFQPAAAVIPAGSIIAAR
ncbi:MAG: O-antigen ligase family protein [Beijerinckiaceae bacterium]